MKRIVIIGSEKEVNFGNQKFKKDIIEFISNEEAIVIPHTDNYDIFIKNISENPRSIMLFCPHRIPKNIKKKLSQDLERTKEILERYDVIVGYLKLDDYKVERIVRCFDKSGEIDNSQFPRKYKTPYQNKHHRFAG